MKRRLCMGLAAVCMLMALSGCGKAEAEGAQVEGGAAKESAAATATADEKGNYLVNGSFEEPDFTGWNVTNIDNVTEELDIYTSAVASLLFGQQRRQFHGGADCVRSGSGNL